jgi:hypothetical protein
VITTVIRSHHTTWVFDSDRMRFARLPLGTDPTGPIPESQWEVFHSLEVDADTGEFTVTLNPAGTRLLRSWKATLVPELERTTELHLDVV